MEEIIVVADLIYVQELKSKEFHAVSVSLIEPVTQIAYWVKIQILKGSGQVFGYEIGLEVIVYDYDSQLLLVTLEQP